MVKNISALTLSLRRASLLSEGAAHRTDRGDIEDEEGDRVDAMLVDGVSIRLPNCLHQLLRLQEGSCFLFVNPNIRTSLQDGVPVRRGLSELEVPVIEAVNILFRLPLSR
eukprot:765099-Hanusia_phi.AAC.5